MAYFVAYTTATGALVSSGPTEPIPGAGQAVKRFAAGPVPGATWSPAILDYVPSGAPDRDVLRVRSVQKLSGSVAVTAAGSTTKTFAMPSIAAADPSRAFVENVWCRVTAGSLAALVAVFADVTGENQVTVVVNSPVAQSVTLQVGGRIVEYG